MVEVSNISPIIIFFSGTSICSGLILQDIYSTVSITEFDCSEVGYFICSKGNYANQKYCKVFSDNIIFFSEQVLSPLKASSTTDPFAILPLFEDFHSLNKKIKLPTKGYSIGFDLKHTSLGLPGSAIFSGKWMPGKSYIEIENGLDTSDFTIMAWIYLRADEMKNESTLFDFRSESDDSLLHMVLLEGKIQAEIPAENKTIVLSSPGNKRTYHIGTG